ncbi:hypothetical protein quinque_016229 [Culex quinquefasciatus]
MKHFLYIILISILLSKHYGLAHVIRKRQLFREQVLPHAGGKIPDSAFHTDRLALNRLQKDGIAVPDGVLLEQRHHQVYPHPQRGTRPTFLVAQTPDGRYTSLEGQYHHNTVSTVDSTYAVPMPWEKDLYHLKHHSQPVKFGYHLAAPAPAQVPVLPVYKDLRIPNYSLFNFDYGQKGHKLHHPAPFVKKPLSIHPTKAIVAHDFHQPAKPSLSVLPQNFVSYHAALGNLIGYQPAYAYGNDWTKSWNQPGLFHSDHLSQPLSNGFEDFFGDPGGKHRYYRNVNRQEVGTPAEKSPARGRSKQHPSPSSRTAT